MGKDSDWKLKEKVVALIEQNLQPNATVEHDINLPVLTRMGETRQCDVVIRTGMPTRVTITIIEVQKRKKKIEINDFNGWIEKMREVGAQHLICVSEKGFPNSVIEKARQIGPTVRLVTLHEIQEKNQPFDFISNTVINRKRHIIQAFDGKIDYINDTETQPHEIDVMEVQFILDDQVYDTNQLFFLYINYLEGTQGELPAGNSVIEIKLPIPGSHLYIVLDGQKKEITQLYAKLEIDIEIVKVPLIASTYTQIDYQGELAWLLEAKVSHQGTEKDFQMILIPDGERNYRMSLNLI